MATGLQPTIWPRVFHAVGSVLIATDRLSCPKSTGESLRHRRPVRYRAVLDSGPSSPILARISPRAFTPMILPPHPHPKVPLGSARGAASGESQTKNCPVEFASFVTPPITSDG